MDFDVVRETSLLRSITVLVFCKISLSETGPRPRHWRRDGIESSALVHSPAGSVLACCWRWCFHTVITIQSTQISLRLAGSDMSQVTW